jgi:hypothetical protein
MRLRLITLIAALATLAAIAAPQASAYPVASGASLLRPTSVQLLPLPPPTAPAPATASTQPPDPGPGTIEIACTNGDTGAFTTGDYTAPLSWQLQVSGCVPVDPTIVPQDAVRTDYPPAAPVDPATGINCNQADIDANLASDPAIYMVACCTSGDVWSFVKDDPTNPVDVQEQEAGCVVAKILRP